MTVAAQQFGGRVQRGLVEVGEQEPTAGTDPAGDHPAHATSTDDHFDVFLHERLRPLRYVS